MRSKISWHCPLRKWLNFFNVFSVKSKVESGSALIKKVDPNSRQIILDPPQIVQDPPLCNKEVTFFFIYQRSNTYAIWQCMHYLHVIFTFTKYVRTSWWACDSVAVLINSEEACNIPIFQGYYQIVKSAACNIPRILINSEECSM